MKSMRDDLHVLTGSYALDAIGDDEREEFERHLQGCPSCDAEVRGLRETAARLAMTRAVTPPARMEQRVLAATYQTRQLPPLAASHIQAPRRFSWSRRVAVAAAAASVAAAVGLGVAQMSTQDQLDTVRASGAAIARVVTAPDAHVAAARTSAGGSVTVVTSAALRESVVSATGLAPLPSGRVYQVWVMSPSGARSAGLLQNTQLPNSQLQNPQLLASAVTPGDRIGITIEPSGGTTHPTTTPIAILPT